MTMALEKSEFERILHVQFLEVTEGRPVMNFQEFMAVTKCKSGLFAQRLFSCIDTDGSCDISFEEFLDAMYALRCRETGLRIRFIFRVYDLDGDGTITREELGLVISASLQEGDIDNPELDREGLVAALLDLFDSNDDGEISFEEFERVMIAYPDILQGLSLEGIDLKKAQVQSQTRSLYKQRLGGKWEWSCFDLTRTLNWISNNQQKAITCSLLTIVLVGCFYWRFQYYMWDCDEMEQRHRTRGRSVQQNRCHSAQKRMLMGWSLPIAKGCGQAMKVIFTLILLPVSRNLMTSLRSTFLKSLFCFDEAVEFHRLLGKIGFVLAWCHSISHLFDVLNWSDPSNVDIWKKAFPREEKQPSTLSLIATTSFGVTGLALLSIYSIAALFAFDYPKKLRIFADRVDEETRISAQKNFFIIVGRFLNNFNYFWFSHHLFAIFYLCLLFHPLPHIPDERKEWGRSDTWVWIIVPVCIYLSERAVRYIKTDTRDTTVLAAETLPGKVVGLKLLKPRGMVYTAGQYVFLKCPGISNFEWHPFTLTSAPGDSFLGLHVRVAGDWTQALYDMVKEHSVCGPEQSKGNRSKGCTEKIGNTDGVADASVHVLIKCVSGHVKSVRPSFPFRILVDGPFGAPCQNYKDYNTVLLVGAGIGVTPFASVLGDLLDTMNNHTCARCGLVNLPHTMKTNKVYFYWTVRSRSEAGWFKHILEALSAQDNQGLIDINIHITSIRRANDVRVMLLRMAQRRGQQNQGIDAVSGFKTRTVTHFGRPNWTQVFQRVKKENPEERDCGVFFCGPGALGRVLGYECNKHSDKDMKFVYHQEIFG